MLYAFYTCYISCGTCYSTCLCRMLFNMDKIENVMLEIIMACICMWWIWYHSIRYNDVIHTKMTCLRKEFDSNLCRKPALVGINKANVSSCITLCSVIEHSWQNVTGMSCPSWEWHRTRYRWSPVRTLLVSAAPLWCDLGRCSPGRTVVIIKLRRTSAFFTERNEGVYMLFSMLHNKAASVTAM